MDTETAAVVIQYHYRKWFYRNAECCISYKKLRFPCFIYRTTTGKNLFYDFVSLNKYFTTSGNYIDPLTRNEYTPSEIERFHSQFEKYFPDEKIKKIKLEENFPGIFGEPIPPDQFSRNAVIFNVLRIMNGMGGISF